VSVTARLEEWLPRSRVRPVVHRTRLIGRLSNLIAASGRLIFGRPFFFAGAEKMLDRKNPFFFTGYFKTRFCPIDLYGNFVPEWGVKTALSPCCHWKKS